MGLHQETLHLGVTYFDTFLYRVRIVVSALQLAISEVALAQCKILKYLPSVTAPSYVFLALLILNPEMRLWTPTLHYYASHSPSQIRKCLHIHKLFTSYTNRPAQSSFSKYSSPQYKCVAEIWANPGKFTYRNSNQLTVVEPEGQIQDSNQEDDSNTLPNRKESAALDSNTSTPHSTIANGTRAKTEVRRGEMCTKIIAKNPVADSQVIIRQKGKMLHNCGASTRPHTHFSLANTCGLLSSRNTRHLWFVIEQEHSTIYKDAPKAVLPSIVGSIDQIGTIDAVKVEGDTEAASDVNSESDKAKSKKKLFVGSQALGYRRDYMEVIPALKDGVVIDRDLVDNLWHHVFRERLLIDPKEHPMLLAEPSSNSQQQRERTTELIFEKYKYRMVTFFKSVVVS